MQIRERNKNILKIVRKGACKGKLGRIILKLEQQETTEPLSNRKNVNQFW